MVTLGHPRDSHPPSFTPVVAPCSSSMGPFLPLVSPHGRGIMDLIPFFSSSSSLPGGLGSVQHLLPCSQPPQGPKPGCPGPGRGTRNSHSQKRTTKDRVVAPQTCHRQPGGTHRLDAGHLLGDPDGKGSWFTDPKGSTCGFVQCGGSSQSNPSCPRIFPISIAPSSPLSCDKSCGSLSKTTLYICCLELLQPWTMNFC